MDPGYLQSLEGRLAKIEGLLGRLARATENGGSGGASSLDGLSDVVLSATTLSDVLQYDGSQWIDAALTHLNVAAANKDGATGTPSMRTIGTGSLQAAAGDHTHDTRYYTQAAADALLGAKAPTASPTFTGTVDASGAADVRVPTAAVADDDTSAASTAWVNRALGNPSTARPAVRAYATANQSIATATDTAVVLNAERYDLEPTGIHDTVTNNTRLTCVTPGVYAISAHVNFDINATGWRSVMIRLNGTTVIAEDREIAAAGIEQRIALSTQYQLAANDYIEVIVRQTSGGALNLVATGNYGAEAAMAYVGASSSAWGQAGAYAYLTAAQSIPNITETIVNFTAEEFDTEGEHDLVTNNSRLTCVTPGRYHVIAHADFNASATGIRLCRLLKNGVDIRHAYVMANSASVEGCPIVNRHVDLVAGDYLEMKVYQDSGGALNLLNGAGATGLSAVRVGYQTNPNSPPSTRAYNSAALAVATATWTALTLNSERHDNAAVHSTASNTSRLTAPIAGVYDISAMAEFQPNATGSVRLVAIRLNGTTFIAIQQCFTSSVVFAAYGAVSTQWKMAAGDYVELCAYQDSGGSLNVNAATNSPEFAMTRISDG